MRWREAQVCGMSVKVVVFNPRFGTVGEGIAKRDHPRADGNVEACRIRVVVHDFFGGFFDDSKLVCAYAHLSAICVSWAHVPAKGFRVTYTDVFSGCAFTR